MRRLLVTGGAGFIGSNFVHYWLDEHPGDRVVVLDALTYAGNPHNLLPVRDRPELRFVRGDIRDGELVEALLREESLDTVVHFAAESHVDRSITDPAAAVSTNVTGTHVLLEAAREVWLENGGVPHHRFHQVSSDEIYGTLGPSDPAFVESSVHAPNSPYAASKAAADHLVRAWHRTFGLRVTTSICTNNYGARQFPEKLIPLLVVNILRGRPLPIYGDGRNVRDWLHVADHCHGIDLALSRGVVGEVYNIGGGVQLENLALAQQVCSLVDAAFVAERRLGERYPDSPAARGEPSASLITFVADRAGHDRRYAIDCSKARRELGYQPRYSLDAGLSETVHWYLGNDTWWRAVLDGRHHEATL